MLLNSDLGIDLDLGLGVDQLPLPLSPPCILPLALDLLSTAQPAAPAPRSVPSYNS